MAKSQSFHGPQIYQWTKKINVISLSSKGNPGNKKSKKSMERKSWTVKSGKSETEKSRAKALSASILELKKWIEDFCPCFSVQGTESQ